MKKLLAFFVFVSFTCYSNAQTVEYFEDFENGIPDGWTVEMPWVIGTPEEISTSGQFGISNYSAGSLIGLDYNDIVYTDPIDASVISAPIDLPNESGLFLELHLLYNGLSAITGAEEIFSSFDISTDGNNWIQLGDFLTLGTDSFGTDIPGMLKILIDLNTYSGETIYLRFRHKNNFGESAAFGESYVDNIRILSNFSSSGELNYALHTGPSTLFDEAAEGAMYYNQGWVINNGTTFINSFDLTYTNGLDSYTTSFENISIPPSSTSTTGYYKYISDVPLLVEGDQNWTVSISNVNGNPNSDATPSDNRMSFNLNAVSGLQRSILVEDATGTWCPNCPLGTAYMEELTARFPDNIAAVAVHNDDPMVLPEYDSSLGALAFPSYFVNRDIQGFFDNNIVSSVIEEMSENPVVNVTPSFKYDNTDSTLTAALDITFLDDISGDFRIGVIIIEDEVYDATDDGYRQTNIFSATQESVGGYELIDQSLTDPYNHVGRGLIGGFEGLDGIVSGSFSNGDMMSHEFSTPWQIPFDVNVDKIKLIGVIMDQQGVVLNTTQIKFADGLVNSTSNEFFSPLLQIHVDPNPFVNELNISTELGVATDVELVLLNALGQVVFKNHYPKQSQQLSFSLNMEGLSNGYYFLRFKADTQIVTQKIIRTEF